MTHQPFDQWIFIDSRRDNDLLTHEQLVDLQHHLDECEVCRALYDAWHDVKKDLRSMPEITPRAGFSSRWLEHLEAYHEARYRRTVGGVFAFSGIAGLLIFGSLVIISFYITTSPVNQIQNITENILQLYLYFEMIFRYATAVIGTVSRIIPFSWFLLFAGLTSELIVIWFLLFRIITTPRSQVL